MRQPRKAPGWLLAAAYGVPAGLLTALVLVGTGSGSDTAVLIGVATGGVSGIAAGPWARRVRASLREALGDEDSYARAQRTLASGVPTDPRERAAAATLAQHHHERLDGRRRQSTVLLLVLAAGSVFVALTGSPWWFAATAGFLGLVASEHAARRAFARRLAELEINGLEVTGPEDEVPSDAPVAL